MLRNKILSIILLVILGIAMSPLDALAYKIEETPIVTPIETPKETPVKTPPISPSGYVTSINRVGDCRWEIYMEINGLRPGGRVRASDIDFDYYNCETGIGNRRSWGPIDVGYADPTGRFMLSYTHVDYGTYHYIVEDDIGNKAQIDITYDRNYPGTIPTPSETPRETPIITETNTTVYSSPLTLITPIQTPIATPIQTPIQEQIPEVLTSELPDMANWVLIGGIIFAILLVGIVVMRTFKGNNTKKIEKLKPVAIPPEKFYRKSQAGLIENSKEPDAKKPKKTGAVSVKSAYEYKGAKIYFKIKVENNTPEPISDIKLHLFVPEVFLLNEKEKSLSMLEPKESKTVTFEIRPTGECGDCNVSGKIEYYDYSTKGRKILDIETRNISVICPVLKRKEIDVKQWEQATDELIKAEENIRELSVPAENLFNITSRVIKDNGMFMLRPEITSTPQLFNEIAMFYAEGVTGLRYAAYIEVVGGARKSRLILKVWAEKEEALTGFYHRILDEIEKRIDVKIFIDDAVVQQHIHIGDRIGTQVKDSIVQRSTIGAGARKCLNCGREVEVNEKFCPECGAKL